MSHNFYFTFGADHPFSDHYVHINTYEQTSGISGEGAARNTMCAIFGHKWCGCYTEEEFAAYRARYKPLGLCSLELIGHTIKYIPPLTTGELAEQNDAITCT